MIYLFVILGILSCSLSQLLLKKSARTDHSSTLYEVLNSKVFENAQSPYVFSPEVLDDEKITYLNEIKKIFEKHHTSYKIIISPLYDQMKLKRATYMTLCDIFGKQNVYDFSGVNKWNRDYHNYSETSHYRPKVAAEILEIIYSGYDGSVHQ